MRAVGLVLIASTLAAPPVRADDAAAQAHAMLDARRRELESACFRGNVAAAMGFSGKLTASLAVDASGRVSGARVLKGTGLPARRDECVASRLRGMALPKGTPRRFEHEFVWTGRPPP